MTVPSKFSRPIAFPPELRAKYPLPDPYVWDDARDGMLAAVMKRRGITAYFLLFDESTVYDFRKENKRDNGPPFKTLGLEDSMRLIQALLLFGD